ncbi:MAG TPA: DNA polymerase IV [archaeon]|nr:DNA polymerase IV [archaeon]
MNRIILHVDFDYFYAQLEELRKPELKEKPIAVCMFSGRTEFSGAVATSNYKAREKGVKAGMPIAFAKQKIPEIILIKADREYYSEVSNRIMELMREHSDKFEQAGIDEAYIDVTEQTKSSFVEAKKIAEKIKKRILEEEKLTCSVGVAPNKLIAKMASGFKKPGGLTVITEKEVKEFLRGMRIKDLHGIGPKTVEILSEKGITTIPKLVETPIKELQELFGENKGVLIHEKSIGFDESPVEEKEKQQYSRILTLKENTSSAEKIFGESKILAQQLSQKAKENNVLFRTISIILISNKLESVSRSRTLPKETQSEKEILSVAKELFEEFFSAKPEFVARRFGLRVSNFSAPKTQKTIFDF